MRSTEPGRFLKLWDKLGNKEYRQSYAESFVFADIADQIVRLRKSKGLRQEDLAAAASKRQSQISKLENPDNNEATLKSLLKIASAFDVALSVKFIPYSSFARDVVSLSEKVRIAKSFVVDSADLKKGNDIEVAHDVSSKGYMHLFVSSRAASLVSDRKYILDSSRFASPVVKRVVESRGSISIKQSMQA